MLVTGIATAASVASAPVCGAATLEANEAVLLDTEVSTDLGDDVEVSLAVRVEQSFKEEEA